MKCFKKRNLFAVCLFFLGMLCNTQLLGWFLAADHQIGAFELRIAIYCLQALCIFLGTIILFGWEPFFIRLLRVVAGRFPYTCVILLCLLSLVLLWSLMELGLYGREKILAHKSPNRYEGDYPQALFSPEPTLGTQLKANCCVDSRFYMGDEKIFDVRYCCDEKGRRATPVLPSMEREQHLLFFGGSFTFGIGGECAGDVARTNGKAIC